MEKSLNDQYALMNKAKDIVVNYFNNASEKTEWTNKFILTRDDVYIVWFSKTLQNWKAMVSTTVSDGMYYELTYNGNNQETYLDAYKKWRNYRIADDDGWAKEHDPSLRLAKVSIYGQLKGEK